MTETQREIQDGKPLGDSGTGASGGGSIGNLPNAATGGEARQGVRAPDASGQPHVADREHAEVADSHRKNHHSEPLKADAPEPDVDGKQTASEAALPSTIDKNPKPSDA